MQSRLAAALFAFVAASAPPAALAQDVGEHDRGRKKGALENLQHFFELNDSLPGAVCDEVQVSRPPALTSSPGSNARYYELKLAVSEERLISFLMEDSGTLLAAGLVQELWSQLGVSLPGAESGKEPPRNAAERVARLQEFRRRVALEVCTSVVTPGGLEKLHSRKPGLFLDLKPVEHPDQYDRPDGGGEAVIILHDSEGRFGKVAGRWRVAGWIEPHEVFEVYVGKRRYRRLANPITNRMRYIQVLGPEGVPLGYLYPTGSEPRLDWKTLEAQAESPANRTKKVDTYRTMVELEAYEALENQQAEPGSVRKLQEFYKNLMSAYQLYPEDDRFHSYEGKAEAPARSEVRKILDEGFFKALGDARMNGARVGLGFFDPDERLHGIYEEYRKRLLNEKRQSGRRKAKPRGEPGQSSGQ